MADEPTGSLDSKTGLEIIKLLEKLNAYDKTIIMVSDEIQNEIGRFLGILFGFGISKIIGIFLPFKPVLTVGILFTSIIVRIVFGIIPDLKASKLYPIKAIYK